MKYAVHTPTQQDWDRLMKAYEEFTDWRWSAWGKPTKKNYWLDYIEKTCVRFENVFRYYEKQKYIDQGYTVLTVDQAIDALKKYGADAPNHNLMTKGFYKGGLEVGDIIVEEYGDKAKVLEVGETSFLLSYFGDFNSVCSWYTYKQAIKRGWTIKGAEETVKMTMAEVNKALGKNVEIVE